MVAMSPRPVAAGNHQMTLAGRVCDFAGQSRRESAEARHLAPQVIPRFHGGGTLLPCMDHQHTQSSGIDMFLAQAKLQKVSTS